MSQNSPNAQPVHDGVHHSKPIPISTQHLRHRSASFSSESSNSPASSPPLPTPKNFSTPLIPHSPTSPFYFLSQSPSKAPATFPFRGFPPPPVFEDDTSEERIRRGHARRGSVTSRLQPQHSMPEAYQERGASLFRRLSLGGNQLGKPPPVDIPPSNVPQTPPNSAVPSSPTAKNTLPKSKPRRSATITEQMRPRRAPSPMGERILKGHFDGFN